MVLVTQLTLTESAARRVAFIADKQAKPAVLRLAVDGGGCAGFTYRFALGEPEEGDTIAETAGVRLVVDPVSVDLLDGSEVDYVEDREGRRLGAVRLGATRLIDNVPLGKAESSR